MAALRSNQHILNAVHRWTFLGGTKVEMAELLTAIFLQGLYEKFKQERGTKLPPEVWFHECQKTVEMMNLN